MTEKIAVLMGGRSLEREVSLASGKRVCEALESAGYRVLALDMTADLVETLRRERPDAAYIALHGKYGEDGTIQELLEFLGVPYTGPGVVGCALSWDKSVTKHLLRENGVATPPWITLTADAFKQMGAATAVDVMADAVGGFPVAVKPSRQGSALGLMQVEDRAGLAEALLDALSYDTAALVERHLETCPTCPPLYAALVGARAELGGLRDPAEHASRRQRARQTIVTGYDVRTCAQAFIRGILDT